MEKELFVQYHDLKKEYQIAKMGYEKALEKKAEYLYSILPGSTNTEMEIVKSGNSNDRFLNYTIKTDEIDKEIEVRRNLADNTLYRLKLKRLELRDSKEILDKLYVYRYIDRISVRKFCKLLNYSRAQIYRKLDEIREKIKDETK